LYLEEDLFSGEAEHHLRLLVGTDDQELGWDSGLLIIARRMGLY